MGLHALQGHRELRGVEDEGHGPAGIAQGGREGGHRVVRPVQGDQRQGLVDQALGHGSPEDQAIPRVCVDHRPQGDLVETSDPVHPPLGITGQPVGQVAGQGLVQDRRQGQVAREQQALSARRGQARDLED